jgi:hypothetical protein
VRGLTIVEGGDVLHWSDQFELHATACDIALSPMSWCRTKGHSEAAVRDPQRRRVAQRTGSRKSAKDRGETAGPVSARLAGCQAQAGQKRLAQLRVAVARAGFHHGRCDRTAA